MEQLLFVMVSIFHCLCNILIYNTSMQTSCHEIISKTKYYIELFTEVKLYYTIKVALLVEETLLSIQCHVKKSSVELNLIWTSLCQGFHCSSYGAGGRSINADIMSRSLWEFLTVLKKMPVKFTSELLC